MADYFRDILDRLHNTAHEAKAVHSHPFTGERERLHARGHGDRNISDPALGNELYSNDASSGLPDLFSDKA
ncbi:MAG: hypothetical protein MI743_08715, partial [Sneathiellales bacterium]|nr:hypothetical protein [Sneathiellales bacterium]